MTGTPVTELEPHFDDVQSHYDLSDDFFALFLDPTRTYSCAYFSRDDMTLEEAQVAKIDLALGKLGLRPGMTLLDIGCGWGATLLRAVRHYDVNVIGLTLSKNQAVHARGLLDADESARTKEVRLQGWEQFAEPVDRIVSIGAFEHFGRDRYAEFFAAAHRALPPGGVMLLHTITTLDREDFAARGLPVTMGLIRFVKFIADEIFPGGYLPKPSTVIEHAEAAGFSVARVQSLQPHYARTLREWSAALAAKREEALAFQSAEVYDRYMKYLTGCAELFGEGYIDVCQFTLVKDTESKTPDPV